MNAGAFGGEIWQHVLDVQTIDRRGVEHLRAAAEYRGRLPQRASACAERKAFLPRACSLSTSPTASDAEVRALLAQRKAAQPIGAWSCGSVFTNPPGDHAARLIEAAGSRAIASAMPRSRRSTRISSSTMGRASAAEVEQLIEHVRATVERVHGIRLTPEVRILGEPA